MRSQGYWRVALQALLCAWGAIAHAGGEAQLFDELRASYATAAAKDDTDSFEPVLRLWTLLELVPTGTELQSLYVPAAHTRTEPGASSGPARLVWLPATALNHPLLEVLRRQLSERTRYSAPLPQACTGDAETFTDCCTQSPTLICLEDARTLAEGTTLFPSAPLYAATAMDLVALELLPQVRSVTTAQLRTPTHDEGLVANSLNLIIGDDRAHAPQAWWVMRVRAEALARLLLMVHRLEAQIAKRQARSPRLGPSLVCRGGAWRRVPEPSKVAWLSGQAPLALRGGAQLPHLGIGISSTQGQLAVTLRSGGNPFEATALLDWLNADPEATTSLNACFGPAVGDMLNQARPLLNLLRSPELSALFVAWLHLAGTLAILSDG